MNEEYNEIAKALAQQIELSNKGEESTFFTALAAQAQNTYQQAVGQLLEQICPDLPSKSEPAAEFARRYMITGKVLPHPEALELPYLYKHLPYKEAGEVTHAVRVLLHALDEKLFGGLHK